MLMGVASCWLLQPQIWDLLGKKKERSTLCCSLGARLPGLPSLHLLEPPYSLFMYNVQYLPSYSLLTTLEN